MVKPIHFLLANVFASDFARGIVRVALGWVVLEQHGAAGLSLLVLITSMGQFFGSMIAGHFTDNVDRKSVAVFTTSLSALGVFALAFISGLPDTPLVLLCLLSAAVHFALSIMDNATRTLIPAIVEDEQIEKANAQFITVGEVGFFVAPLLAGYWTAFFGPEGVLAVGGVIALIGAAGFLGVSNTRTDAASIEVIAEGEASQKLNVLEHRWLCFGVAIAMTANLFLVPISYVLAPVVIEIKGLTAVELGYFYAAMSVGFASVGFLSAERISAFRGSRQMSVAICLAAITYLAIIFFQYVLVVILCGILAGFFLARFEVAWKATIQRKSPTRILGRVYAFSSWTSFAARSAGVFMVGLAISSLSPQLIVALLVAATLTIVPIISFFEHRNWHVPKTTGRGY